MLPSVVPKGRWKRSARVSSWDRRYCEQSATADRARTHVAGEVSVLRQEDVVRVKLAIQCLQQIGDHGLVRQHSRISQQYMEVSPVANPGSED